MGFSRPKVTLRMIMLFLGVVSADDSSIAHWAEMCSLICSLYNPLPFSTDIFIGVSFTSP